METLYNERLKRYTTALRNEKPDMVPIRPFVAEFVAKYANYTCQEVTHDYHKAFEATLKCCEDFDWDAAVANMVYVWTGLTEAIGLRYYGVPGLTVPPDRGFQYLEPSDQESFMKASEYDALIDDPTGFLLEVWLPRVARDVVAPGEPVTLANNLSFLKGGMAMLQYFNDFGPQVEAMRTRAGTVSAIAGIFKAPLDILADKLRGYVGLTMDLMEQPDKVLAACEALMPHLYNVALTTSDPTGTVPLGFWMHRGCVPFVTQDQFDGVYWPTLKPIIEELWKNGRQTLFYAEGDWNAHLDAFAELPDRSIVYHVDRADIFEVHRKLGHKFCLSGGVSNFLLAYGSEQHVRDRCREIIEGVAGDGGYLMDASAIVQNDAQIANMRAMVEATREFGVYEGQSYTPPPAASAPEPTTPTFGRPSTTPPGQVVPWEQKRPTLSKISGDEALLQDIWEQTDSLANMYAWQCLLSF